jgi:hypothetical protein
MKEIRYLSPTAIMLWEDDREAFYLQYLADFRPPRTPQTQAMAIGAAFDAYVKSFLTRSLFGSLRGFDFVEIFENQVESHNRDWAMQNGAWAFECYRKSGALADLLLDLQGAEDTPRFEFQIENRVAHTKEEAGVVLLGKPDIFYKNRAGCKIVHDWKVNGYMSSKTTSPRKGYMELYDAGERRGFHKDVMPKMRYGLMVSSFPLEDVDKSWATQLSIYSWILGTPVGSEFLTTVHQLCCRGGGQFPVIRVASHRNTISEGFQIGLWKRIQSIWEACKSGVVLDSLKQQALDNLYKHSALLEVL